MSESDENKKRSALSRLLIERVTVPPPGLPVPIYYDDVEIRVKAVPEHRAVYIYAKPDGYRFLSELFAAISAQDPQLFEYIKLTEGVELPPSSMSLVLSEWKDEVE